MSQTNSPPGSEGSRKPYRKVLRLSLWTLAAATVVVGLLLVLTRADALIVAGLLLFGGVIGTGLLLEKIDPSRRPPEDRPPGWKEGPHDHWGFRGRPGS